MKTLPNNRNCAICGGQIRNWRSCKKYCSMECRNKGFEGQQRRSPKTWDDYPEPVLDDASGCLRWQGRHHVNGYGMLGRNQYAHREAWLLSGGEIPDGMTIDHVAKRGCIHRDCVNVDHMEVVSQSENCRRGQRVQEQIAKTHCPKGHPYSGENLIVRRGKRECRECGRDRCKAAYHRRKNSGNNA